MPGLHNGVKFHPKMIVILCHFIWTRLNFQTKTDSLDIMVSGKMGLKKRPGIDNDYWKKLLFAGC